MKHLKRILNIIFYIICGILIAYFLFNFIMKQMGYSARVVLTPSMEPTIKVGSIVYDKKVDFASLKQGDIITFTSSQYNKIVTHRITSIDYNNLTLITKGDNNTLQDASITSSAILGKVMFKLPPVIGYVVVFIQQNYIFIVIFAILIVILSTLIDKTLKKQTKENL